MILVKLVFLECKGKKQIGAGWGIEGEKTSVYITWIKQLVFEVGKEDGMIEKMGELLEVEERNSFLSCFVLHEKL